MILNILIFFLFGLIIGSFLSVIVSRTETGESIISGRSKCPKCKKKIKSYDLVPVLSFFILRGECRNCKNKISAFYPLIEIVTGTCFALLYWRFYSVFASFDSYLFLAIHMIIISALVVILFYDSFYLIIPDKITYPVLGSIVLLSLVNIFAGLDFFVYNPNLLQWLIGVVIGGGLFLFLVLISKEKWMGWGDVKLGFLLGAFLGYPLILVGLFFAFLLGSIFGVTLIALKKKKMQDMIPFGPFLVIGSLIALFFGRYILSWYFGI